MSETETRARNCHIVMVDDDEEDIFIMRRVLRRAGLREGGFHALPGGPELLAYLKHHQPRSEDPESPDLILLDINMPRMNGFEVLDKLRRQSTTRRIPVIVFSTSARELDIKRSLRLGARDYIVKPQEAGEFDQAVARIRSHLEGRCHWQG